VFDGLKARLDKLMAEHTARPDARATAAGLREALIEAKAAVAGMRDGLARAERELAHEREELLTAERRGKLAADIQDAETVQVAERFIARHRERAALLERKVAVQREELALAEREVAEMTAQFQASTGLGGAAQQARSGLDAAWRDLEAAGGIRPESDLDGELDRMAAERKLYDAAVDAQLAHLKRKLGKE
jgi:hypothetical protein